MVGTTPIEELRLLNLKLKELSRECRDMNLEKRTQMRQEMSKRAKNKWLLEWETDKEELLQEITDTEAKVNALRCKLSQQPISMISLGEVLSRSIAIKTAEGEAREGMIDSLIKMLTTDHARLVVMGVES